MRIFATKFNERMKNQTQIGVITLTMILAVSLLIYLCAPGRISAAPPLKSQPAVSVTNSVAQKAILPSPTNKTKFHHQLTGAELYSIHCNRCHPERYPTERTAAQWKTIMLHMQVRANLPASQAKLILKYLQDNSGR